MAPASSSSPSSPRPMRRPGPPPAPARPALLDTLTELPRAGLEATRLAWSGPRLRRRMPSGDGHPVLVLPAYGTGDLGMLPLRRFLARLGYAVFASELGVNLDRGELRIRRIEDAARFRRAQSERVAERARAIQRQTGRRTSLIGWSMGGLFAFDAAWLAPDSVRRVVTLGAPFGDPRGTALWDVMRRLNGSTTPVEEQDFDAWLDPAPTEAPCPVTILFSPRDGIVGEEAARLARASAAIRYEPVASSHLGFAVNPAAYHAVARVLADDADA